MFKNGSWQRSVEDRFTAINALDISSLINRVGDVEDDIDDLIARCGTIETNITALQNGKQNKFTGTTAQYVRGDASLATFPSIPDAQVPSDWSASTGVARILNKPTIPAAQVNSDWSASSGVSQILNKPTIPAAQVQSDWTQANNTSADFIKNKPTIPAAYTDENAQDAVGNILSAEFVYDDPNNAIRLRDYAISTPTFSNATTAAQLSTTRKADVFYAFDATVTISLLAGQSVTATLRYADNVGMSTNVVVVDSQTTNNSGVLGLSQTNTLRVGGKVPAGKYRQVTFTVTGGATAPSALKAGQEALL